jgi:enamine deaminase RidA (YjgF/YER057c/UK114 family)
MTATSERARYSPAVKVANTGHTLYIAGQVGRNPDRSVDADPETQIARAWENLGLVLAEAGASYGDVVDIVSYHTDMTTELGIFAKTKNRYVTEDFPAWTAIGCTALAEPALICEIKATAVIG